MPKLLPWTLLGVFSSVHDLAVYKEKNLCCVAFYSSDAKDLCQICYADHGMVEQRIKCVSSECKKKAKCTVVWKLFTCPTMALWKLFVVSDRNHTRDTACLKNERAQWTPELLSWIAEQDESWIMPKRMYVNLLSSNIRLPPRGRPTLIQIRGRLKTERKKNGKRNAHRAVKAFIHQKILNADTDPETPFLFTDEEDDDGKPCVGIGSDVDPFMIGITSKAWLDACLAFVDASEPCIFHVDTTFKLSDLGYPVVTCGVTDRARTYQPLAMFIVSRRTTRDYARCLSSVSALVQRVFGKCLHFDAIMGDAEDSQYNAFGEVSTFTGTKFLMCFFHVLYNVRRRTRHLSKQLRGFVTSSVMEMHYSGSECGFFARRDRELVKWRAIPQLRSFSDYFEQQWLRGRYTRWQIYHTPCGYATTNNPCETFNAAIKKYATRRRFHLQMLMTQLMGVVKSQSIAKPTEPDSPVLPNADLKKVTKYLGDARLVSISRTSTSSIVRVRHVDQHHDVLNAEGSSFEELIDAITVSVLDDEELAQPEDSSIATWKGELEERKAAKAANKLYKNAVAWSLRRAHRSGMPEGGWVVNVKTNRCQCNYFTKFGTCAHILVVRKALRMGPPGSDEPMMVSRVLGKRARQVVVPSASFDTNVGSGQIDIPLTPPRLPGGRPLHATHALDIQFEPLPSSLQYGQCEAPHQFSPIQHEAPQQFLMFQYDQGEVPQQFMLHHGALQQTLQPTHQQQHAIEHAIQLFPYGPPHHLIAHQLHHHQISPQIEHQLQSHAQQSQRQHDTLQQQRRVPYHQHHQLGTHLHHLQNHALEPDGHQPVASQLNPMHQVAIAPALNQPVLNPRSVSSVDVEERWPWASLIPRLPRHSQTVWTAEARRHLSSRREASRASGHC